MVIFARVFKNLNITKNNHGKMEGIAKKTIETGEKERKKQKDRPNVEKIPKYLLQNETRCGILSC